MTMRIMQGAVLRNIDWEGADLRGANLGDGATVSEFPLLQIIGLRFPILFFDNHTRIGCEQKTNNDWINLECGDLTEFGEETLWEDWVNFKPAFEAILKLTGRLSDE